MSKKYTYLKIIEDNELYKFSKMNNNEIRDYIGQKSTIDAHIDDIEQLIMDYLGYLYTTLGQESEEELELLSGINIPQ